MNTTRMLAECRRLAPDFTFREEDSKQHTPRGLRTVRIAIARCTVAGRPLELSETVGPGAEERVLSTCLRDLRLRRAS